MNSIKYTFLAICLGGLAACGGGGGDAGTPPFGGGGASQPSGPVASDIILAVNRSSITNGGTDEAMVTVTAVDGNRQTISGAAVAVSADTGAVVTANDTATGADGKVVANIGIGNNKANRLITVTASSGTASRSLAVAVTGTKMLASAVPAVVKPGAAGTVVFTLQDNNSSPIAGQAIQVSATGLTPSTVEGVTKADGSFTYSYVAGAAASGSILVTANAGGVAVEQAITIEGTVVVPPITTPILSASIAADPSVVGVNQPGQNVNRATLRATFRGNSNKAIANVRVRFDLAGDTNSVGGTISSGDNLLYTDATGSATATYVPGQLSSPVDGVTIRACYGPDDASLANGACPTSVTKTLTVSAEPLGVTIGTNAEIIPAELTYIKKFVVSVVDVSGRAMGGVDISANIKLEQFRKGGYEYLGSAWTLVNLATCDREDLNDNGFIDEGEDLDGDGRLEPRPSDVILTVLTPKTDANGLAQLQIEYAQNFATWVNAKITVSATGVAGTEGRDSILVLPLPAPNTAFTTKDITPAFYRSPYGVNGPAGCANPN